MTPQEVRAMKLDEYRAFVAYTNNYARRQKESARAEG